MLKESFVVVSTTKHLPLLLFFLLTCTNTVHVKTINHKHKLKRVS